MKNHKQKSVPDDSKHRDTQGAAAEDLGTAIGSEQPDINHPHHKKSPATGSAHFESRPFGRHTSRMVGHEPGTGDL